MKKLSSLIDSEVTKQHGTHWLKGNLKNHFANYFHAEW